MGFLLIYELCLIGFFPCQIVNCFSDKELFTTSPVFCFPCWNHTFRSLQNNLLYLSEWIIGNNPCICVTTGQRDAAAQFKTM